MSKQNWVNSCEGKSLTLAKEIHELVNGKKVATIADAVIIVAEKYKEDEDQLSLGFSLGMATSALVGMYQESERMFNRAKESGLII